ncbi:MAG: alpha,alpha-trehalase TreF [Alphaproteobacteria bacterium]|nr:alpha,alpha-trehalase TreF [Alphaproteobacteria bacterium]
MHVIRGLGIAAIVATLAAGQDAPASASYPKTPLELFGALYKAVESARVFDDSKEFADAVPDEAPDKIMQDYDAARPAGRAALNRFVLAHFTLPEQTPVESVPAGLPLARHIDALWSVLTRQPAQPPPYASLLPLPHPYVVPGGRFREMYYWDSYFTMLGLIESGRNDLVRDMVGDFASLIDRYGHVPNGNRTYYLTRSQPPFFFAMVALTSSRDPAGAFAKYLPELKKEYAFWMAGAPGAARVVRLPDGALLNRYWDGSDRPRDESYEKDVALAQTAGRPPSRLYRDVRAAAESGWDFSSRWFADGRTLAAIDTTEIIPVDLNSLLYGLESAISLGCKRSHDACASDFANKAAARQAAMNKYLWNAKEGAYFDYNWRRQSQTPRLSAATLYPLFVGAAREDQARAVAQSARRLVKPGGLVTTLADTGQQWDAPNGWAPLQWIAVSGLTRYHEPRLSEAIACRWLVNVRAVYRRTGRLVEKYDVVHLNRPGGGGEYKLQDGFGWTNGVTRALLGRYPADARYTSVAQCPAASAPP